MGGGFAAGLEGADAVARVGLFVEVGVGEVVGGEESAHRGRGVVGGEGLGAEGAEVREDGEPGADVGLPGPAEEGGEGGLFLADDGGDGEVGFEEGEEEFLVVGGEVGESRHGGTQARRHGGKTG